MTNKCVMASFKPQYVEMIQRGNKKIDLRKTKPDIECPFTVYIYCTKPEESLMAVLSKEDYRGYCNTDEEYAKIPDGMKVFLKVPYTFTGLYGTFNFRHGVVGEFTVFGVDEIGPNDNMADYFAHDACATVESMYGYFRGNRGYAWHIENPVFYKDPKDLSEFRYYSLCDSFDRCKDCPKDVYNKHKGDKHTIGCGMRRHLSQPPQSWYYVEELQEIKKKGLFGKKK